MKQGGEQEDRKEVMIEEVRWHRLNDGRIIDGLVSRRFFPGRKYFCEDIEDNERKDEKSK
jgi:hypothetical protein